MFSLPQSPCRCRPLTDKSGYIVHVLRVKMPACAGFMPIMRVAIRDAHSLENNRRNLRCIDTERTDGRCSCQTI